MSDTVTLYSPVTAASVVLPTPLFGYKAIIVFPFDFIRDDAGVMHGFDNGLGSTTYDLRYCECTFQLTGTQQAAFNSLVGSVGSRGANITMTLSTTCGFFPFGPDKGDTGVFTVALEVISQRGRVDEPRDYFEVNCRITNVGVFPAYSIPTAKKDGNSAFQIGTVPDLRYPPNLIQPQSDYAVSTAFMTGPNVLYGDKTATADSYTTTLPMVCNQTKAAALVSYLANVTRLATFSVITDTQFYLYGRDKGSAGTYNSKFIQDTIEIMHNRADEFQFDLNLQWVP